MRTHAELLDEQVDLAEERERVDELETHQQEAAEEDRQDEGQNLVVGQRAAKHADADETRTQQEQADVGAPDAAAVEVAFGQTELVDREIIDERGYQGQNNQCHASKELRPDDLPVRQRLGEQHLDGARAVFLGEAAHRHGGHEEKEDPRRDNEEAVEVGVLVVQHVEVALEHPKKQAGDEQKHHNHHNADQRAEEVADFFLI